MDRRIVDLSHVIHHGMVTYPGLPAPEISDHLTREASRGTYAPGTEFQIGRITMVANTGTYLDTPAHRYEGGEDLSEVGIERLVDLAGVMVDLGAGPHAIGPDRLGSIDVTGKAVLLRTGWDRHWGDDAAYGDPDHPHVTEAGAAWLVEHGAAVVGIDSVNIDDTRGGERPAHSLLLGAGIPVVEHLRGLELLPADGFRFHAAPPMIAGMGTFPVRAYAVVERS